MLVLIILRRCAPVMFFYAFALFSILKARVDQVIQFSNGEVAQVDKYDSPTLLLYIVRGRFDRCRPGEGGDPLFRIYQTRTKVP